MTSHSDIKEDVSEVVKAILKVNSMLKDEVVSQLDGDTLSVLAVKLASYKAYLGGYVADYRLVRDQTEAEYFHVRETAYKRLRDAGSGVTDAESQRRLEAEDARKAYIDSNYKFERLNILHGDCRDMIDAIKSRLIHLQTEAKEANHSG